MSTTSLLILVVINSSLWLIWSVVVGFTFNKIPDRYFENEKLGVDDQSYRFYEKLSIKKWKARLPEAGTLFKGGTTKKTLVEHNEIGIKTLAIESQRAEFVHWCIFALTPVFYFFNPAILIIAMTAYGILANIPFIYIQRYNRSRCLKALKTNPL